MREDSWKMFDQISGTYDRVNRILSFGIDLYWRKKVGKYLPQSPRLLDLATGTGDQLISLLKRYNKIHSAVGVDLAEEMLAIGRKKLKAYPFGSKVNMVKGSGTAIPFDESSFDAVTISFGIRNIVPLDACMKEMHRVLSVGGKAVILEFSLPSFFLLRWAHLFYLRKILPFIGGLISKKKEAYRYLNQTIESFPYGKNFCSLLEKEGFSDVKAHPLTGGIATIYVATK